MLIIIHLLVIGYAQFPGNSYLKKAEKAFIKHYKPKYQLNITLNILHIITLY